MAQIENSLFLVQSIIADVKHRLERPITQRDLRLLFSTLSSAQEICKSQSLQEEIILLYGKVVDAFNLYLAVEIENLTKNSSGRSLQERTELLKNSPGISEENLKKLQLIGQPQIAIPITSIQDISDKEVEEIAYELLDLAGFVYYGDTSKLEKSLILLSSTVKKQLHTHCSFLQVDFSARNTLYHGERRLKILQAIFATALQLIKHSPEPYWTQEQIALFFEEKQRLSQEECTFRTSPLAHAN